MYPYYFICLKPQLLTQSSYPTLEYTLTHWFISLGLSGFILLNPELVSFMCLIVSSGSTLCSLHVCCPAPFIPPLCDQRCFYLHRAAAHKEGPQGPAGPAVLCEWICFSYQWTPLLRLHCSDTQTRRHTDTHRHTDTLTHRHRHTDTQTHRYTDTQTHRLTDTQTHRDRHTEVTTYHVYKCPSLWINASATWYISRSTPDYPSCLLLWKSSETFMKYKTKLKK